MYSVTGAGAKRAGAAQVSTVHVFDHWRKRWICVVGTSRLKTNRVLEDPQLWDLDCVLRGMYMRKLARCETLGTCGFQKTRHTFGCHVLNNMCGICKLIHRCAVAAQVAASACDVFTGRIKSLDMKLQRSTQREDVRS